MNTARPLITDVPSIVALRADLASKAEKTFNVAILVGPGYLPLDMVGVQTVFGLMPGAEIHFVWKSRDPVEGFPGWWTLPTATFVDCPEVDVLAVPMLPPEIQNDPEVVEFVAETGRKAKYVIGICNGVLLLGAAGLLNRRRATTSYNSISILEELGASTAEAEESSVVVDGNLYTAGPGTGSFEAALLVVEQAFGKRAAELAELIIEYDPRPPFKTGSAAKASPELLAMFEEFMANVVRQYRDGAVAHFMSRSG